MRVLKENSLAGQIIQCDIFIIAAMRRSNVDQTLESPKFSHSSKAIQKGNKSFEKI
jgi:hypothetical protein